MHGDDRERLDELIAERFPHWRTVENEAARTRSAFKRHRRRVLLAIAGESPETVRVPFYYADTHLVLQSRRRVLRAIPGDYSGKLRRKRVA